MPLTAPSLSNGFTIDHPDSDVVVVRFFGPMDVKHAAKLLSALKRSLKTISCKKMIADLKDAGYMDDYGAMVMLRLKEAADRRQAVFEVVNADEAVQEVLDLYAGLQNKMKLSCFTAPESRENIFIRLGEGVFYEAYRLKFMVAFLGSVILSFLKIIRCPRLLRLSDTINFMRKVGVDAVPIVALISFLVGLIMAFVSSIQLRQFGAGIYVASIVALSMVSELGPIMTAIVVAGRSGSAFAAEIGTMRINEEIDALFSMGFSPTLFLAVPRIIAAIIVIPLLTVFSDLFAILGGLVISVSMLDLTIGTYFTQAFEALSLFEFFWGFSKGVVFAVLISTVGCLRGFQVRGGAAQVGNAATSAVVTGIFLIILFDSVFAVIRSYWV